MPDSHRPTTAQYVRTLRAIEHQITDLQRSILCAHYDFPEHAATEAELAHEIGIVPHALKNYYGNFAKDLRDNMSYPKRVSEAHLDTKARLEPSVSGAHRKVRMHPEVVAALKELGWVKAAAK